MMLLERPSGMQLHTDSLIDPYAHLWISKWLRLGWRGRTLWQRIVRVVTVNAPRALYVAIALLNPAGWPEEVWAVHRRLSNPQTGLLVGKTFREAGFGVHQNRLVLFRVLWFLLPGPLRKAVPRRRIFRFVWYVEVYTLYLTTSAGTTVLYGTFVEYVPWPQKPPERSELGIKQLWRGGDSQEVFTRYLTGDVPAVPAHEHERMARQAKLWGRLGAIFASFFFPFLVRLAVKYRMNGR